MPFAVADPDVLNLGCFKVDGTNLATEKHATLDLFAESAIRLAPENIEVPEELDLKVSPLGESRQLQPGVWNTRYSLSVAISPAGRGTVLRNGGSGVVTRAINLKAGASNSRAWQYSVYWQTSASLEARPSFLSFGNLLGGTDDHSRTVAISSTTGQSFRIVAVESRSEDLQIDLVVELGCDAPKHRLRLTPKVTGDLHKGSLGGQRGFFSGTIRVQTNDNLRPFVDIPWSAMLGPAAGVRARPVRLGSSASSSS